MRAIVNTDTQVFGNDFTTTGTFLRRAARVDQYHRATSVFSFVRAILYELSPRHVRDVTIDNGFSIRQHVLNVQLFKGYELIRVDQLTACLMGEVGAAVGRPLIGVLQSVNDLAAFSAADEVLFLLALQPGNVRRVPFHPALATDAHAV